MAKFKLGQLVMTRGVHPIITTEEVFSLVARHLSGDWGDLCDEDWKTNDRAIEHEGTPEMQDRVVSVYYLKDGTKIYIITEWDRSVTTILLPEEY